MKNERTDERTNERTDKRTNGINSFCVHTLLSVEGTKEIAGKNHPKIKIFHSSLPYSQILSTLNIPINPIFTGFLLIHNSLIILFELIKIPPWKNIFGNRVLR